MAASPFLRSVLTGGAGLGLAVSLVLTASSGASAATEIDGPVTLGTAATYGVLGASAVTNTGPTVVNGDLGVSPGTAVTGFGAAPDGVVTGTVRSRTEAAQAQQDARTAYDAAAALTPSGVDVTDLDNRAPLVPGVYSGGVHWTCRTATRSPWTATRSRPGCSRQRPRWSWGRTPGS
ncbi:ice-binding family protein [Curtobacterium sp. MCJR17_043]|uniref:ice-binding family protein n=1 Tax=Curtobacterium sp. MCJR17_043 TaxID=2175660 RepID=UPI0024DFF65F|nr:ice-binding family protein [Curtobacterium sp. MCJR17_043]WIB35816.1 ice-binding family protein [Curtobacterium sp. MCJR17_043]